MDNYDNFFNGINDPSGHTPVYHTPENSGGGNGRNKKTTLIGALLIVIAVIMCIAVVANVIVLASMKKQVAQEYADGMTEAVREEYLNAIAEYLDGKEISDDILAQIEKDVIDSLNTSAAAVAGTETVYSTVQIVATGESDRSYGSGFLITAKDETTGKTKRYVITNAHVVLETVSETTSTGSGWPFGGTTTTYSFRVREDIVCSLMNGELRHQIGRPVYINSGYRTPSHNKKVGGAKYSYHMYGMAADIRAEGIEPKMLYDYLDTMLDGWGGLELHNTFVHVDVRDGKWRSKA